MMETNEGIFTPNKFVDGEITFQTLLVQGSSTLHLL